MQNFKYRSTPKTTIYALLLGTVWIYVVLIPFTKVEESFHLQAIRDLLKLKLSIQQYDHLQFPGVVPRTFLASIPISILSFPFCAIFSTLFSLTDLIGLYISRMMLGLLSVLSFSRVHFSVGKKYGNLVADLFLLITVMQFHLPFYMSRTLPNTFALILTNFSIADWISATRPQRTLHILICTMICFRCDVLLVMIGITGHLIFTRQLSILSVLLHGSLAVVFSLVATVMVDSWFWGRWLWPEGEVFFFNAILNKSSDWGVMPFHWYFTSALPRALLLSFPLSLLGPFLDRRVHSLTFVSFLAILLFSKLGHKEVRFLFPVLPLLNISAAVSAARFIINRKKGFLHRCCFLGLLAGGILSLLCTWTMARAAAVNYPGGMALARLHEINGYSNLHETKACHNSTQITLHIGVLPAQTGISRFAQLNEDCWSYSKEEGLIKEDFLAKNFTYLLTDQRSIPGYRILETVESFGGFEISSIWRDLYLRMKMKSAVFILQRV